MFWLMFLTCLGMTLFSLLICILVNWRDIHTIGDFFAPLDFDSKSDNIVLYIPAVNIVVTAIVISIVIFYYVEHFFQSEKVKNIFTPIRRFFEIKVK